MLFLVADSWDVLTLEISPALCKGQVLRSLQPSHVKQKEQRFEFHLVANLECMCVSNIEDINISLREFFGSRNVHSGAQTTTEK